MATIRYQGRLLGRRAGETVLDALLRQGENPPFSCRNGACLVCLQRCTAGEVPEAAQRALRPALRRLGYFLPCKAVPPGDVELGPVRPADLFGPAVVVDKAMLAPDVCRLRLETATALYYHAGQFVNLRRADGLTRSYSLASVPHLDEHLEVHVKRMPGGQMSGWLVDQLAVGDELELQGPSGRGFYPTGAEEDDLLLIGSGTGVAPLLGVARDALASGHRGRVVLFAGSRHRAGLYADDALRALAAADPRLEYVACLSGDEVPPGFARGRAHRVAFGRLPRLDGWRLFLAGHPVLVAEAEVAARHAGAAPERIHADPFETRAGAASAGASGVASEVAIGGRDDVPRPPADPELWRAVGGAAGLRAILEDFYDRVFTDGVLGPYFRGVSQERVVGQVFGFLADLFTGERTYFGLRPRTAHHWMVISDETFDHRARLVARVLDAHRVPPAMIERWLALEERYRGDVVKGAPWPLVVGGVERPVEGFGDLTLSAGTMCDGCQEAIEAGEAVRYHLRLGLTYCARCTAAPAAAPGEARP